MRKSRALLRRIALLPVLTGLIFACSSPGDRLVLLGTPYFEAAHPDLRSEVERRMYDLGISTRFDLFDANLSSEAFIKTITTIDAAFVVVSPLLADFASAAATVFPDRRFIVLYADGMDARANIQRVGTDRSTTYYDAGTFAARLLLETIGTRESPARLLVLAYTGTGRRVRELEVFLEGYHDSISEERIGIGPVEVREYSSLEDGRNAARYAQSVARDFSIALVTLGLMNSETLRAISTSGTTLVITEAAGGNLISVPDSDNIAGIIVEDWIGGIELAVDSRNPRVVMPTRLVPGPDRAGTGVQVVKP